MDKVRELGLEEDTFDLSGRNGQRGLAGMFIPKRRLHPVSEAREGTVREGGNRARPPPPPRHLAWWPGKIGCRRQEPRYFLGGALDLMALCLALQGCRFLPSTAR